MPSETGYWNEEEIIYHDYSFPLARWIAKFFYKGGLIFDFGAGDGFYSGYLQDLGYLAVPVEGNIDTVIYAECAMQRDLSQPFELGDYNHSICLEVGEHIPAEFEKVFIDNIANNTKYKLVLSWAVPEQEGYFHVNCKPNEWVIAEFEKRGFKFLPAETESARSVIEERRKYFRDTLMVFENARVG